MLRLAPLLAALPCTLIAKDDTEGLRPDRIADRWIAATAAGDASRVQDLLAPDARVVFESDGKSRQVDGSGYAELLEAAVKDLKSFQRERGPVEAEETPKGLRIVFEATERFHTREGFALEAISREELLLPPGGGEGRAVELRSRTLSQETLGRPESWLSYGGPSGLNGLLIDAHFRAPPKGMALVAAAAIAAIALLLKAIHSLGIRRRF
jgi:hypothetical protein